LERERWTVALVEVDSKRAVTGSRWATDGEETTDRARSSEREARAREEGAEE